VVDVIHSRTGGELALDEVEVFLTVETRGPDNKAELLTAFDRAGYAVRLQN